MADLDAPAAFTFRVSIEGSKDPSAQVHFQEVSGLEPANSPQPIQEGGENRFPRKLPSSGTHNRLTLRRGWDNASVALVSWAKNTLESEFSKPIEPKTLLIDLIDVQINPVARWKVEDVYPEKFSVGTYDAMKNVFRLDVFECRYRSVKRTL